MCKVGSGGEIQCTQCYRRVFEAAGVCPRDEAHKSNNAKWIDISKESEDDECIRKIVQEYGCGDDDNEIEIKFER